jgi:hypothetical protein
VIGLIEGAIERNKAEPQRRVLALEQLLFWIPLAHCVAWVVFVVLRMIAIGDSKMIPVSYLTTVGVLLIPIVYAIGAIINPEAADKYTEPEDKLKKLKHRALLFNFATAPFTLTFLAVRALVRKVRRTDLSDKWTKLIRAFHSKSALPAGIFCAIGALVGCIFHNPWIGGFAGMGVGYLEYFLVRRFAPWAFYPAN